MLLSMFMQKSVPNISHVLLYFNLHKQPKTTFSEINAESQKIEFLLRKAIFLFELVKNR